jgi:hypothetical protein
VTPKQLTKNLSHRDEVEALVAGAIAGILQDFQSKINFIDPTLPPGQLDELDRQLAAVLLLALMHVYRTEATKVASQLELSTINIEGEARDWAWKQTKKIVQDFRQETLKTLAKEKLKANPTNAAIIAAVFNPFRSLPIAATQVTAAANSGELSQVRAFKKTIPIEVTPDGTMVQGKQPETITTWRTRDDSACHKCSPLNGKPEEIWSLKYPEGPPAHKNCRCFTTVEIN